MQVETWLSPDLPGDHEAWRTGAAALPPDLLIVQHGAAQDAEAVLRALHAAFGAVPVHGGSSCRIVMADGQIAVGKGIAVLAITDPDGRYGTASAELGDDPRASASRAVEQALAMAGRSGEAPDLVWLTVAPGAEPAVLAGIKDVVGPYTRIVGGSSADDDLSGAWTQMSHQTVHRNGLVVSVLFPSVPTRTTFQSGYSPSRHSAVATRVEGRRLVTLDHRPAAEVYLGWLGLPLPEGGIGPEGWPVMGQATQAPLGQVSSHISGVPFHVLSHPAVIHADGSITLFADLTEGARCWMMQTTGDALVSRAASVARSAAGAAGGRILGGLLVFCAGCMFAVEHRVDEIGRAVSEALGGAPFLGVFSFGEQGCNGDLEAVHGNLMMSCTVFGSGDA